MLSPKPTIVTQKVFQAASSSGPPNSTNCSAICQGLGKMKSAMLNSVTISCHNSSVATSTTTGLQRSIVFVIFMRSPYCGTAMPALPSCLRKAPMCPRNSCTMSVKCGV